jgi:TPR repeat protein
VTQDLEQAAMWYRKAAAWGLDDAKKRLAGVEAKQKSQAK